MLDLKCEGYSKYEKLNVLGTDIDHHVILITE